MLNLQKGEMLNLTKSEEIKKLSVGLGWKTECDLDSLAVLCDENHKRIDYIYFGNLGDLNTKGVKLSGDDLVGGKDGDCENIFINLDNIPKEVKYIDIYCNIFTPGPTFGDVKDAYIRLVNIDSGEVYGKYTLTEDASSVSSLFFARLTIENSNIKFEIVSKLIKQKSIYAIAIENYDNYKIHYYNENIDIPSNHVNESDITPKKESIFSKIKKLFTK